MITTNKIAIAWLFLICSSCLFGQADMKTRLGVEMNANFNFERKSDIDFGVNCLFTSAYTKNGGMDLRNIYLFGTYFGMFQFGPSITFNPIKIESQRAWRAAAGITYTQISDFNGLGLSIRAKGMTVLNKDKVFLNNFGLKTEVGLTIYGVISLYYGYVMPIKEYEPYPFREHSITLTMSLNPSILAYGLKGM